MRGISFFLLFFVLEALVFAEDLKSSKGKKLPEVYIQENTGSLGQIKIVEGKASIQGEPRRTLEMAFTAWEKACDAWKKELKLQNKSNLLISNCGTATQKNESRGLFSYRSQGDYKIKVTSP